MHGVTTAIVGFIFVCIVFPKIIKNRPQYYAAVAIILFSILVDAAGWMIGAPNETSAFRVFAYVMCALLQVIAIILLLMSAGGLRASELGQEFAHAYEVMRRGEDEKEVIIPRHGQNPAGQQPPPQQQQAVVQPIPGMPNVVVVSPPAPQQAPPPPPIGLADQ